jgi:hypothetical protein
LRPGLKILNDSDAVARWQITSRALFPDTEMGKDMSQDIVSMDSTSDRAKVMERFTDIYGDEI